ncbi:MAG: ribose-phosphate diphosphokinase [Parvibaculum sp.]
MSGLSLHAFKGGMEEAARIARRLGVVLHPIDVHCFPDGESLVTVSPPQSSAIVYASLDHPNERLMDLLLAAEALRRNGVNRLVLVAPYLCYMRQDKAFHDGEAISQHVMGRLLGGTFDRIVTIDPHLHRVKTIGEVFPGIESESLTAAPAIATFVRAHLPVSPAYIVGPDAESKQWVDQIAAQLGGETIVGFKRRMGDRHVEIEFSCGPLEGRSVLLVDDIVSSGATLIKAIGKLKARGAGEINVAVTHALFGSEQEEAMRREGAAHIWSTFSAPHPTNRIHLDDLLVPVLAREVEVVK